MSSVAALPFLPPATSNSAAPGAPGEWRPVRSFVLREGRLTRAQARACVELWPRFGLDWIPGQQLDPLDLPVLFGNRQPVFLDIGFGNGEALLALASAHPERNYLGLEVHRPGIGQLLLALQRQALANVRVLRADARQLLTQGLAPASLAGILLWFPDPWPKPRQRKRRLLQPALLDNLAQTLRPGGLLHAATDCADYAEAMRALLDADARFANLAGAGRFLPEQGNAQAIAMGWIPRPDSRFARRARALGHLARDLVYVRR